MTTNESIVDNPIKTAQQFDGLDIDREQHTVIIHLNAFDEIEVKDNPDYDFAVLKNGNVWVGEYGSTYMETFGLPELHDRLRELTGNQLDGIILRYSLVGWNLMDVDTDGLGLSGYTFRLAD